MKRFDVSWWGKAGTFGLMVAFPFFLLGVGRRRRRQHVLLGAAAGLAGIPALLFSYYAAITYIPMMRQSLAEGRRARVA